MADAIGLSDLEKRILAKLGEGKGDVEIANELAIPFDDAKRGVQSVMRKLGVSTREEAAAKGKRRRRLPGFGGLVNWIADTRSGQATVAGLVAIGVAAILWFALFGGGDDEPPPRVLVAQIAPNEEGVQSLTVTEVGVEEPLLEIAPDAEFLGVPRFSADGTKVAAMMATGDEGALMGRMAAFDVANQTIQISEPVPTNVLSQAAWSHDGTRLATSFRGLAIYDASASMLGMVVQETGTGVTRTTTRWSNDSQFVATVAQRQVLLGTRDGEVRTFTEEELAEPPPAGFGYDPASDTLLSVDWDGGNRLRVVYVRRNGDLLVHHEASAFVRGTEAGWSPGEELSANRLFELFEEPLADEEEARQRTLTLVEGTSDVLLGLTPPWETADRSAMVQLVPHMVSGDGPVFDDVLTAVVLVEPPEVFELRPDPELREQARVVRDVDVVVLR